MRDSDYTLVIPTYNGGDLWRQCIAGILSQSNPPSSVVVVDSSSSDDTCLAAEQAGFHVVSIPQSEFDHGGTRTFALQFVRTDHVVFLTQDAILENENAIEVLLSVFDDPQVGAAYGRQLPHYDANPLVAFARQNSYKNTSYVTGLHTDTPQGFRKAFLSNSFSAYDVPMLKALGAFPNKLILGEDSYVAAKLLVSGKRVAYSAGALVRHSHNYRAVDEFKRYFDIGVFHSTQYWMIDKLGQVEGEGVKFALGQLQYLVKKRHFGWLLTSFFASFAKYIGYKLGRAHTRFNRAQCQRLSMYKSYWNE
jgi:rhamnosyltransferase